MVIYALVAEESVGKLFLGSAIPGIMIGLIMLVITLGISYWKKYPREEIRLSKREQFVRIRQSILAIIMPVFVIGSVHPAEEVLANGSLPTEVRRRAWHDG